MTKTLASFLAGVLLALVSATAAHAQQTAAQPLDRIVAVVNENVVLRSELDRALANIRSQ